MEKGTKTVAATPKRKASQDASETLRPRAMSLEKAKKLIRKTSAEHEGLFRRLAK
jgi:hypothetical protein